MNIFSNQALFLAALFFSTSIFCNDFDIFKETLTLSIPVEAQESPSEVKKTPSEQECVAVLCQAQQKAFEHVRRAAYFVAADDQAIIHSIHQLQKCAALSCPRK